jgi:hypothetical protein
MAETHTEPEGGEAALTPEDLDRLEEEHERWAREEAPQGIDYERIRKHVIQRDGKPYIQYVGLLDLLHQESHGEFTITTKLEQAPTTENGMLAVVSAIVSIGPNGERTASGLGDASPGSVNRMMAPHLTRMAETRAKGRALRDLLNIPYVTAEELGPEGPAPAGRDEPRGGYDATPAPPVAPETIEVDGRTFTRQQVWSYYVQRMNMCRERHLNVPQPVLTMNSPLKAIVAMTQTMRSALERQGQPN